MTNGRVIHELNATVKDLEDLVKEAKAKGRKTVEAEIRRYTTGELKGICFIA